MDAALSRNSVHSYYQKLCHAYALKRSCFFLLLFLLLPVVFLGVATLIIIFVMKPQKPIFSLEDVSVDSYKLNAYSGSTLFVSSVITLTLNAQNHNKVGIWYSPSHLEALYDGLPIGTIRIPGFLQPAHSSNVSMQTRVLFPCVNASQIVAEASLQEDSRKNMFQMKIVGDVGAHLLVFHMILLKIKVCSIFRHNKQSLFMHPVALECDINIDYRELTNKYEFYNTIEAFRASFPSYQKTLFMYCTLALYI